MGARAEPPPPPPRPAPAQEVGMGSMECYEKDWEEPLLKETAEYYRRKAAAWIQVRARGGAVVLAVLSVVPLCSP